MRKMRTILSSEKGETILETLVALLIIVIAISFLTGAITKSSKITGEIRKINENGFEYKQDSSSDAVVSVTGDFIQSIGVTVYGVKQYEGAGEDNYYYYYEP